MQAVTDSLLLVILLVHVGATARLTRLATKDVFPPVQRARDALIERLTTDPDHRDALDQHHAEAAEAIRAGAPIPLMPELDQQPAVSTTRQALAYLLECAWCASMWVALLTSLITRLITAATLPVPGWAPIPLTFWDLLLIPAIALATSHAVGWLSTRE